MEFIKLSDERKKEIINESSSKKNISVQAVEKDWWVTQTLRAICLTEANKYLVFKGGTSLSKGWGLIDRFSEDIDFAVNRELFGINKTDEEMTNSQISSLRKKSGKYIREKFNDDLKSKLIEIGISESLFEINVEESTETDKDPQTLYVKFKSLFTVSEYLKAEVKIEISARSKMEPYKSVEIKSIIGATFANSTFADSTFTIESSLPQKTFLEKCILLHETFLSNDGKVGDYKSRHLSDLERLMDTSFAKEAIEDHGLFEAIVNHRKRFNALKNVDDYKRHNYEEIDFIPKDEMMKSWEEDYKKLNAEMIPQSKGIPFDKLIERLKELRGRFRNKGVDPNGTKQEGVSV